MRNLKKFLALVLALVMAMSLMLTANAAITKNATDVYPDTGDGQYAEEFQTAIDVLTGMGIFHGENGDFKPTAPILRSEAAAIMYRLVTGDVKDTQAQLYAPLAETFNDVSQNAWYAGYVGYCVDAGYISGYNGDFLPNKYVTGYEMLKMLLKAVGYGQNGEFVGASWRINVGSLAQQLGVLKNIETTHYANTLAKDSPREVVAELAFQVAAYVYTVRYEYGYYNQYTGVVVSSIGGTPNPTLGQKVFGLTSTTGVVIGNQDTGESNTRLGLFNEDGTRYTWNGSYDTNGDTTKDLFVNNNRTFSDLVTGIGQFGHKITVWHGWSGTYAWYDNVAKTATVTLDPGDSLRIDTTAANTLGKAASGAGFTVNSTNLAVFNDFFGLSGEDKSTTPVKGSGQYEDGTRASIQKSPINMYLLISNDDGGYGSKTLDMVIPLNIEASQITQSNAVRGVETVSMPVTNAGDGSTTPYFISDKNVNTVSTVPTGIIAKNALTKEAYESTSTLGDYELGIHINGTSPRNVGSAETAAILGTGDETAYFLLYKVEPKKSGTVVYYNVNDGIVVLDDGTTLNRSIYYDTVVGTKTNNPALPQAQDAWNNESYNYAEYTFYLDFDGNYLGAQRGYTNEFFYGTYLDYAQPTSSSTFTYYLTGVTLNGEVQTRVVEKVYNWDATQANRQPSLIQSTNALGVPYRDTYSNSTGLVNGLNTAWGYIGYTVTGTTLDPNLTASTINVTDYPMNMERLGIIRAVDETGTSNGMSKDIAIDKTALTLGLVETETGSNLFLNNSTKIILVSGYGEDSLTPEVYNGINELVSQNNAAGATIHLDTAPDSNGKYLGLWDHDNASSTPYAQMTFFQKSPYTFAQSGDTAEQVNVIILPKAAVTFTASASESGVYFMGDPNYTLISSHDGSPIYQYTVYDMEGYAQKVWIKTAPNAVYNDTFVTLTADGTLANDGSTVYKATFLYDKGLSGVYSTNKLIDGENAAVTSPIAMPVSTVTYKTTARNSLAATFEWTDGTTALLNVASANVTNLNTANSPSGSVWPGIVDLATLNEAGSINPVTGTPVRVAAVVDGLIVTQIFVCWDQR